MDALTLASASPRRAELLRRLGVPFEVVPPDVDETAADLPAAPKARALELARRKAEAAAAKVAGGWVLAADTIVVKDNAVVGKPKTAEEAVAMLKRLAGGRHKVLTAVCVVRLSDGEYRSDVESTGVILAPLSDEQVAAYVATGEALDKAGGYALQGLAAAYVGAVHGDPSNVVGLPLPLTLALLHESGYPLPRHLRP